MDWNGKRILVSNCYGLGDLITCTPALRRLKELYPACRVTLLANSSHLDAVRGLPYIDQTVGLSRGSFLGRWRLLPVLRQQDAVAFTDWQPQLLFLSYLLRIPLRGGVAREGRSACRYLTRRVEDRQYVFTEYAGERRARELSEALGVTISGDMTQCDVALPGRETQAAVDVLLAGVGLSPAEPFLLLAPFAANAVRHWPQETARRFVEQAEREFGLPVVIIGAAADREAAAAMSRYNLAGQTTLPQMVECMRRARLVVATDSGPMHVAGALGKKTVALFSTNLPSRWAPRRNCRVVTLQFPCVPCGDQADLCGTAGCIKGISAELVLEQCRELERIDGC